MDQSHDHEGTDHRAGAPSAEQPSGDATGENRIEEIKARLAAAPAGPWVVGFEESWNVWESRPNSLNAHCIAHCGPGRHHAYGMTTSLKVSAFIANAPADIAFLLAEVERLSRGDFTAEEFQNLCHKFNEQALLAEAQVSAAQWRPVESAPSNESILVFIPNSEHYGPGVYRAMKVDMGTGIRWMTSALHCGRDCGALQVPTHWMPLPEEAK